MTEDDKLKRAYRDLAREEPSAALDAAILAKARTRGTRSRFARWAGPVSIAAVLVLGIGVSLRMQLETPGIETSAPGGSAEYPVQGAEPAPAPQKSEPASPPPSSEVKQVERAAAPAAADAMKALPAKPAPKAAIGSLAAPRQDAAPPASAPVAPEEKIQSRMEQAPAPTAAPPVPAVPAPAAAPAAAAPAPAAIPRAKRESMMDSQGARELRKSLNAAEADPTRELERIAALREAGRHAEADKALEEFRKGHPDFRIPEAMWERVRPR